MVISTNTILGIPAIPDAAVDNASLKAQLDAMKEAIEVLTGARGDPNNRAITYGEATEGGETDLFITNRVVETAIGAPVSVRLSGDVAGTGLFAADGTVVVPANIQLPNIVLISGGSSDTVYSGAAAGPYGIEGAPEGGSTGQVLTKVSGADGDFAWDDAGGGGGGGSALEVEDDGTSLSVAATLLNFVGFTVTEPTDDEITITAGVASAASAYAPGYDYSQVSTTTFTIDLADAFALFRPGRRIKFGASGVYTYGSIASRDFDSTAADDTFVTMTMEDSDTIPATIDELYLVSGDIAWSAISGDPFSGTQINDIATGVIGGTQWWVAVGDGGKIATSIDKGATWTIRTSGTASNIMCVGYEPVNQTFWVGGDNQYFSNSTNGSTWTDKSSLLTETYMSDAADDIVGLYPLVAHSEGMFIATYDDSRAVFTAYRSDDEFATYTLQVGTLASAAPGHDHYAAVDTAGSGIATHNYLSSAVQVKFYTSWTDATTTTGISEFGGITAFAMFEINAIAASFVGGVTGKITYANASPSSGFKLDDVTFANPIRGFAHSATHNRVVCVGESGMVGYLDESTFIAGTLDAWTSVANGVDPLTDILCVAHNESDGMFVACAANGQIIRSSNGTN